MINNVSIKNFKSLKDVSFEARRVNIFIGEPNTGKSNLLEALGVFSATAGNLRSIVRFQTGDNLFYDNEVANAISIDAGKYKAAITFEHDECQIVMTQNVPHIVSEPGVRPAQLSISDNGGVSGLSAVQYAFRYYKFSGKVQSLSHRSSFLSVPDGDNLFNILRSNREVRTIAGSILESKGYRLNLRIKDHEMELVKEEDNILYTYPYQAMSDTLQRIIFYLAAIKSNKDAILLFEEPEAHTFPFYTKYLAECIALEENNQYFIVTHNPYFLLSLVEKTPMDQLAVFLAYMENYETKFHPLSGSEIDEVLDLNTDVFFNFKKFLPKQTP